MTATDKPPFLLAKAIPGPDGRPIPDLRGLNPTDHFHQLQQDAITHAAPLSAQWLIWEYSDGAARQIAPGGPRAGGGAGRAEAGARAAGTVLNPSHAHGVYSPLEPWLPQTRV